FQVGYLWTAVLAGVILIPILGAFVSYLFSRKMGGLFGFYFASPGDYERILADDVGKAPTVKTAIMYGWVRYEVADVSLNRALQAVVWWPAVFATYLMMMGMRDMYSVLGYAILATVTEIAYLMFTISNRVINSREEKGRARDIDWGVFILVVLVHAFEFAWIIVTICKYPWDGIRWYMVVWVVFMCVYLGVRTIVDLFYYRGFHVAVELKSYDNESQGDGYSRDFLAAVASLPRFVVYQLLHRVLGYGVLVVCFLTFFLGTHGHNYAPQVNWI
ncbi:hypothetical protein KDA14_05055, partial [Candidatus Saccharibacteria bacterium]|nr:hypothetical protein [Candidatus Saccharibacteria bacterium]